MALVQFVVLGGVLGAIVGHLGSRTHFKRTPFWGLLSGLILSLGFMFVEEFLQSAGGTSLPNVIWQGLLFSLWGLVLGWLIQGVVLAERKSTTDEKLSRREALYLGGTALGALLFSASGIRIPVHKS
jgi:hypothetical protein